MAWSRILVGAHPRRTAVRVAVLAAAAFVVFRWVLLPIRTDGISMRPTYESGELRFVNRLAYLVAPPRRGDVVAIRMAGPHVVYVKRVVGLPGERFAIVDGIVQVNGHPLDEPYIVRRRPWNLPEITLEPREYFLVGDNRDMAMRAMDMGRAPRDRFVGKVVF
jgi:signal peptidase I